MKLLHKASYALLHVCIVVPALLVRLIFRLLSHLSLLRLRRFWLKPRPGDIYIATSPKAGTTLMQMLLHQLVTGGRGEFEHILQVSPYLEQVMTKGNGEKILDDLPSPRLLKTHLGYEQLRPPRDSKVIYVTRNMADSLISAHHHVCLAEGSQVDFDTFFRHSMMGGNAWTQHLESWWPHRDDENVLHVRYEELIEDLEGSIRKIAAFCDIPLDESRMGDILEKCSLPYMKQNTHRFDFRLALFDPRGLKEGFIRKGGVGGARARLSEEQQLTLGAKVDRLRGELGIAEGQL